MEEKRFEVTEMPRASAINDGHTIEFAFKSSNEFVVLKFDAVTFETMMPRMMQMILDAKSQRLAKPSHS
jgi:hypothetical protein